jgi:hypothetical protein
VNLNDNSTVRARLEREIDKVAAQRGLLVSPADIPRDGHILNTLAAWSPESLPVRVRYGNSVEIRLADRGHKAWKVVLHPDRIEEASSLQ